MDNSNWEISCGASWPLRTRARTRSVPSPRAVTVSTSPSGCMAAFTAGTPLSSVNCHSMSVKVAAAGRRAAVMCVTGCSLSSAVRSAVRVSLRTGIFCVLPPKVSGGRRRRTGPSNGAAFSVSTAGRRPGAVTSTVIVPVRPLPATTASSMPLKRRRLSVWYSSGSALSPLSRPTNTPAPFTRTVTRSFALRTGLPFLSRVVIVINASSRPSPEIVLRSACRQTIALSSKESCSSVATTLPFSS